MHLAPLFLQVPNLAVQLTVLELDDVFIMISVYVVKCNPQANLVSRKYELSMSPRPNPKTATGTPRGVLMASTMFLVAAHQFS